MKKIVKLNRSQLRRVLSEAIQGKQWGDPEPFAVTGEQVNEGDLGSYEIEASLSKAGEAASLLADVRDLLETDPELAALANEAFTKAYDLMSRLENDLGEDDEVNEP